MVLILGKTEIPMLEDLFQIKNKEKETINGDKAKNYLVGGKTISSMENFYMKCKEKLMI